MLSAPIPADDALRLEHLQATGLLDTPAEERFDRLTRLARRYFGADLALVSLVAGERQWFKSKCGTEDQGAPRSTSFCGHVVASKAPLVVENALLDERFFDNPVVTAEGGVRFYAGWPLYSPSGYVIGSFCVASSKPRTFCGEDRKALADFAAVAQSEISAIDIATRDDLTGLNNRRGFEAFANQMLAVSRRQRTPASLVFIDLDKFKSINDRFGHAEGDQALVDFARCVRDTFRDVDVIGRLGGDEFVVLMCDAETAAVTEAVRRLKHRVLGHNASTEKAYELEFSVGWHTFDCKDPYVDLRHAMNVADTDMYRHKARSR